MKRILLLITICISSVSFGQVPTYVPTNGLVGWWGFNGNANDESGNGNNGTVNGATLTTDRNGNMNAAYYFSGSSCETRVDIDANTSSINGALSISIWVLKVDDGCISPRYFEAWPGSNTEGHFQLAWGNGISFPSIPTHRVSGNTGPVGFSDSNFDSVGNNEWTHLVYVNDGDSAFIWQDGVLRTTGVNPTGSNVILASDISVGRMNHPSYDALNGNVDDIGIWDRALSECEITELYTGQDCNVGITELNSNQPKELIKIVNLLGQEVEYTPNTVLIYQYSDGTSEKVFTIED